MRLVALHLVTCSLTLLGTGPAFAADAMSPEPGSTVPADAIRLNLDDALALASEANFDVLISQQQQERRRQAAVRSRAELLPQISADATQSRSQTPLVGSGLDNLIPENGEGPSLPFAYDRFSNRFDAVLRARLALLDPRKIADYQVAKTGVEIAGLDLDAVVQDVLSGIAEAWFTHYRNQQRIAFLRANVERDRVLLDVAQSQFDGGIATPIDVTRAEVQLASDELVLEQQNTATYESELALKRLLNLDLDRPLVLGDLPEYDRSAVDAYLGLQMNEILAGRSDYQREVTTLEQTELARKAAGWERLPALEAGGQWGYASDTWDGDMEEQWSIYLGVSLPIFEGLRIRANKLEADAAIRQQEIVLDRLEQNIGADYRLAIENIRSRVRQVEIAVRQRNLNERELELAQARFREGVSDNRDVVDAQARLAEGQDALVEAYYRFYLARLRLAEIRGNVWLLTEN